MDEVQDSDLRSPSPAPRRPPHQYYSDHQPAPAPTSSEDEERILRANRIFESVKLPSTYKPRATHHQSQPIPSRCTPCGQACPEIEQPRSAPAKMMREEREREEERARQEERTMKKERREMKERRAKEAQRIELVEMVKGLERQFEEHKL